jgi:pentatricopeptide repeat protein
MHPGRVEALYQEMKERAIQCNLITYNTLLNIFARCQLTQRMPSILDDMRSSTPPVEPDLVTYSTLIKGFCASGQVDHALGLLEEMQMGGKFKPDEMMYNSLLDGCSREERLSHGMRLADQMRREGIAPSNYTLTMLVKLFGRCRRLNQAFLIVDELSAEYGLRPNIQVYTCLIQGCFQNREPVKALSVLDTMLAKGVRPDEKAYIALVRGHLNMGLFDKAIEIVERAYQGESPAGVGTGCLTEVIAKLGKNSEAAAALRTKVQAGSQTKQQTRDHQVRASKRDDASQRVTGKSLVLRKYAPLRPKLRTEEY